MNAQLESEMPPFPDGEIEGFESGGNAPNPGDMLADSAMSMLNNLIAVGGGWFVKIKKQDEFYELDEFVQLIDTQNNKNVKRLLLDEDDKAMLRPLLAQMLAKHAGNFGPEHQFMAVAFSILMKKIQLIMAIRKENQLLEQKLVNIIEQANNPAAESIFQPAPKVKPEPPASPPPIPEPALGLESSLESEIPEERPTTTAIEEDSTQRKAEEATEIPALEEAALTVELSETEVAEEVQKSAPEAVIQATPLGFSPEPSNYEKRIVNAFSQTAKDAGSKSQSLLFRIGMETGDLEGVWFKDDFPYRVASLKDILKMIFGSAAGVISGIGSLAKTKIKGFFAAKAQTHGVNQQRIGLGLSCNKQGRIVVQMAVPGKVVETFNVDQLVEQFQNGGMVYAT